VTAPRTDVAPQLIVIDMQKIFRSSESEWFISGYDAAADNIVRLIGNVPGRVAWTRFVRDPLERGSWGSYYDRWSSCREEPDSPQWELTLPVAAGDPVVSMPTFSKWGNELEQVTAGNDRIVICGVATDCCILSTVLAAVDAGKEVTVVTDACAGITVEAHEQALALMALLAPMVTLVETSQLIDSSDWTGRNVSP
jgi:nicotinamidase-related amidase